MFWIIVTLGAIVAFVLLMRSKRRHTPKWESERDGSRGSPADSSTAFYAWGYYPVQGLLVLLAMYSVITTSVVRPGGAEIAVLDRIYFCASMPEGRNVALDGECGRQATIVMPGFHFSFGIRVLNDVYFTNMIDVPEGRYASLTAKDGRKLDEGQVAARPWPIGTSRFRNEDDLEVEGDMLDASFFLTDGRGRKGPQTTILTPGRYPINPFLWNVDLSETNIRTSIPAGHVAVVRSAIDDIVIPSFAPGGGGDVECRKSAEVERDLGQIRAVMVPAGCRGVWQDPLPSGEYYLNHRIYDVTSVDTRVQNWTYKGGYQRRYIDLTVDDDGSIKQTLSEEDVPIGDKTSGDAIAVKVEGWTVMQELRIQARVQPQHAPLVVAAVGGLHEIEDRIITPQVRSVLRNVGGSRITVKNTAAFDEAQSEYNSLRARLETLNDINTDIGLTPEQRAAERTQIEQLVAGFELPDPNTQVTRTTRVLDFQNERAALEAIVAQDIRRIGTEAGIEIISVTLGNTDLPPELLVARKIEQLSGQLRKSYTQMRTAQVQRQATEAAKARADKQRDLVTARIGVETSELQIQQRQNEGEAERRFLEAQAAGQQAQAEVLGQDRVAMLRALQLILEKPEIVTGLKLPTTVVFGGAAGEGLGAVLAGTKLFGGPAPTAVK